MDAGDRIDAIQWRSNDNLLVLRLRDGRVFGEPADDSLAAVARGITHLEYHPWRRRLLFQLDGAFQLRRDLGTQRRPSPIRGRPVVYLDQNQWSTISKALFAPHRVRNAEERQASLRLLRMAEGGDVILPMSAAHLAETGSWSNVTGRKELGLTILAGSAGWQMRDPLEVRAAEFRAALTSARGGPAALIPDVFTLEPYAALDPKARGAGAEVFPAGLPHAWQFAYRSTLAHAVYVSCMLDQQPTPRGSLGGWVQRMRDFTAWLQRESGRTKEQRRRAARVFALSDTTTEVARAAVEMHVSLEEMSAWTRQTWDEPTIGPPGISMFRSVMVDKLMGGSAWEENDLTDLMYLCTAAGYADHVVGERRTIGLLRQSITRLDVSVQAHTTLKSVVAALDEGELLSR